MKRGGSLSFLVGTISNVLVMEIGWTDVGSGGYILVSCAHSKTSYQKEYNISKGTCVYDMYIGSKDIYACDKPCKLQLIKL